MRRRSAIALMVSGALCLAAAGLGLAIGAGPARAEGEPGSEFGTYALTATASGVTFLGPDPNAEGYISHAVTSFSSGPVGHALSSVAWPGRAGGNLGTTLLILGNPACSPPVEQVPPPPTCPPLPSDVTRLNSPVRAEAGNGSGRVVNDQIPGVTMTAEATDAMVFADSLVGRAEAEELGVGGARSTSTTTLTGPKAATAEATSRVTNFTLGVITLGSVSSTARAQTDAVHSSASGATTVSDATIAGVPVRIDHEGVHLIGNDIPLAEANARINEGLARMGATIRVSDPILIQRNDRDVSYTAGSILISWVPTSGDPPTAQHVFTVILGGASVGAAAEPGFAFDFGDVTVPEEGPPPVTDFGGPPPVAGGAPAPTQSPRALGVPLNVKLPAGVGVAWIVLAMIGAAMVGVGTSRFPIAFLEESAAGCELGEGQ